MQRVTIVTSEGGAYLGCYEGSLREVMQEVEKRGDLVSNCHFLHVSPTRVGLPIPPSRVGALAARRAS